MPKTADLNLIFVVGAPLSGVRWLHDGLVAQDGVASAGRSWLFTRPRGVIGLLDTHPTELAKTAVRQLAEQILTADTAEQDTHIIEATPAHIHSWSLISDLFPHARFLHLRRDGRDVVAALTTQPAWQSGIGRSLDTAVEAWLGVQKQADMAAQQLADRFLTVTYEQAVRHPADFWAAVRDFCQLPEWENTAVWPDPPAEVDYGESGAWRTRFSPTQQDQLETRLGLLLKRYGYDALEKSEPRPAAAPRSTPPEKKRRRPRWSWLRRLSPLFSHRTLYQMQFDLMRWQARRRRRGETAVVPAIPRLHLGCGRRQVSGWLNVDVADSEYDVDIAAGRLPWATDSFDEVVAQHVVEHLELMAELIPLLTELHRVMRPGGTIWLSCPDMEKVTRSYLEQGMANLWADKQTRWPGSNAEREGLRRRGAPPRYPHHLLDEVPRVQMLNQFFHQWGEHKNLFDFDLLNWALTATGFSLTERVDEPTFLAAHPTFPPRQDDAQTLFVRATA